MKINENIKSKQISNIFILIRDLQYVNKSRLLLSRRIIRKLIVESDRKFRSIEFKMKYKHPIFCTSEIFCDYFKECITLQTNYQPIIRWRRKDNLGLNYSLKDYIFSEYPLNLQEKSIPKNELLPSLYALTKHNHLIRIDLGSGIFLEDIFLSKIHKFVRINYNTVEEKFCISTSINKTKEDKNTYIAMFQLYPFSFKYMIEISEKMFGTNLSQASISNNCLLISKKYMVQIYNMFDVLSESFSTFEEKLNLHDIRKFGIKQTVFLKKLPPVLFEVDAPEGSLSIGGFPWHYITNSLKQRNAFNLYHLENNKLALGCPLYYENNSIDEDMCYFHPDDSGVIMHLGSKSLKVIKIKRNSCDLHYLHEIFTISVKEEMYHNQNSRRTKSGRLIKNRDDLNSISDHSYKNIHSIIYDEDLNFLIVAILSGSIEGCAWIQIHDNTTGQHLNTVNLDEYWNPEDEHSIDYDYDTIIHIVKKVNGKETIYIYRLQVTDKNL